MTKDFKEWLEACPYQYDILYDRTNSIEDNVEWGGQVDLAIYTQTKRVRTND